MSISPSNKSADAKVSGVSVGIPIWSSHIEAKNALQDVLSQDSTHINEILISISKSDISRESFGFLSELDSRVSLFFTSEDLSLYENFKKLATLATSDYFVWFCADDRHPQNFISEHLITLDNNNDLNLSSSAYDFWLYDTKTLLLTPPITHPCKDWDSVKSKLLRNRTVGIAPTHLWFGVWRRKELLKIWPEIEFDWLDLYLIEVTLRSNGLDINTSENIKFRAGRKIVYKKFISKKIRVGSYLIFSLKSIFLESEISIFVKAISLLRLLRVVHLSFKLNHDLIID